jgi:aspartyl protease family protein
MPIWPASLALLAQFAVAPPTAADASEVVSLAATHTDSTRAVAAGKSRPAVFVSLDGGQDAGNPITLPRADDGLFYLTARVNGVTVRFLVDTGASMIVLTPADAQRAGVASAPGKAPQTAETAGGTVTMARVRIASLHAGPARAQDVDAAVSPPGLGVSLLGQSWLSQFQMITIARDQMILQ